MLFSLVSLSDCWRWEHKRKKMNFPFAQPIILARKKTRQKRVVKSRGEMMLQAISRKKEEPPSVPTAQEFVRQPVDYAREWCSKGKETVLSRWNPESSLTYLNSFPSSDYQPPSENDPSSSNNEVVMEVNSFSEQIITDAEVCLLEEVPLSPGGAVLKEAENFLSDLANCHGFPEVMNIEDSFSKIDDSAPVILNQSTISDTSQREFNPHNSDQLCSERCESCAETCDAQNEEKMAQEDTYSIPEDPEYRFNSPYESDPDNYCDSAPDNRDPDFRPVNESSPEVDEDDFHNEEESLNQEEGEAPIESETGTTEQDQPSTSSTGKKTRKIFRHSNTVKEDRKRKREVGESYEGTRRRKKNDDETGGTYDYNVPRPPRVMGDHCQCKLSSKSKTLACRQFTETERKEMFTNFWKCMTWDVKKTYVASLVDTIYPRFTWNRKEPNRSRRAQTLKFHLKHHGKRLPVCKTLFKNTLGVKQWWVSECVKSNKEAMLQACSEPPEHESANDEPSTKSKAVKARHQKKMDALRNFLHSLAKMESHYCRQNTKKLYLEPLFQTKSDVYDAYKAEVDKPGGPGVVTLQTFYLEFDRLNLSIYIPRKDLCDTCVAYAAGNCSLDKYEAHQERKKLARQEKQLDNQGPNFVATMDLQGVLLSPRMNASSMYYKMKLCVHNFTLFNNKTHQVKCYVWHEGEGGITSNEFASLITTYIREQSLEEGQDVVLWSDGAGYQNRNINLSMALLNLSKELNVNIIQKYLEVGHTQMECDSIHAQIEKKLKNRTINTPADYVEIMRTARRTNPGPYDVLYLDHNAFKDFSKLGPMKSIRPGNKVGDPCVNDIRALKYTPSGEMFFKLSFSEDWTLYELKKKRSCASTSSEGLITTLYSAPLLIKPDKFTHLQQLKHLIPKDYHYFYDNLRH